MANTLYIFIDGFPHYLLEQTNDLQDMFPISYSVTPGMGYSVNIHAEMFCGLTPDKVGYFNIWGHELHEPIYRLHIPSIIYGDDARIRGYQVDRALHILFRKIGLAKANIPFPYQNFFVKKHWDVYDCNFPWTPYFRNINDISMCISESIQKPYGLRDVVSYKCAMNAIVKGTSIFVSFCDLDWIGHAYGVGSNEYFKRMRDLEEWIKSLSENFLKYNNNGQIFVFSDHGMVNVDKGIKIIPERYLGPASEKTYAYFTDSTTLRFWVKDSSLRFSIEKYLSTLNGIILSNREREAFGVASKQWGDYIFILAPGLVFIPNFLGNSIPKAMHGYHPKETSQKAIFLALKNINHKVINTIDMYSVFRDDVNIESYLK